jgi:transposase-like protein
MAGADLGDHVSYRSLAAVAKQAEQAGGADRGEQVSPGEQEELRRLRKKVAELELEKEILRKAAQSRPVPPSSTLRIVATQRHASMAEECLASGRWLA